MQRHTSFLLVYIILRRCPNHLWSTKTSQTLSRKKKKIIIVVHIPNRSLTYLQDKHFWYLFSKTKIHFKHTQTHTLTLSYSELWTGFWDQPEETKTKRGCTWWALERFFFFCHWCMFPISCKKGKKTYTNAEVKNNNNDKENTWIKPVHPVPTPNT